MTDSSRSTSRDENNHTFSTPVTDRIEMEKGPGRRLTVSFSPATSWFPSLGMSVPLFLAPLFFGVMLLQPVLFSTYYRTVGPIAFVIACFAVAGAGFYWLWTRWLHTATVTVENGAVALTNTPFLASGTTTRIPCDALTDVQVKESLFGDDTSYKLQLAQSSDAATGQPAATGPYAEKKRIWVAGALPNRAEAKWLADSILDAAQQQASSA